MPKIDVSKIGGYEEMAIEDKLAAILALEIPEQVDLSTMVSKATFDKVASELAEAKKTIKGKMSDEEIARAEAAKAQTELQSKYDALLKEHTVSKYKSRYMAQGYDEKLAEATAEALFAGDTDTVFENSEKFRQSVEQRVRADVLKDTPKPEGSGTKGEPDKTADVEFATNLGKSNMQADKAACGVVNQYTLGGN